MNVIFQSPYSKLFSLGLLLFIITAWFSAGYHHPDEHFQLLEFCNYKMGLSPASDLPWEFSSQIRPALQPFIAYLFITAFKFFGIQNPFFITFFLRLLCCLLGWLAICKIALLLIPHFSTEKGKKLFIGMLFFLWFVPYLNVRFSSENAAGISFLWALYFILKPEDASGQKKFFSLLLSGALLGATFFFRFQMAFAILGLGVWLLFIKKINLKSWCIIIFSGLFIILLCICIDRWFYGNWVFTPFNYYDVNITQHAAAGFGVTPWWNYFVLFFNMGGPVISIALFLFFCRGIYLQPKSIFSFVLVPFLIGHFLIGHKEMRFLFPLWFPFIYIVAIGVDSFLANYKPSKWKKSAFNFLLVINFIFLLYRTLAPAQEAILAYKFVHRNFKNKDTTFYCINEPLFHLAGLNTNFYKPATINELVFKNEYELNTYLNLKNKDSAIVFTYSALSDTSLINYKSKRIYCLLPDWIFKFDYNNWQERVNIASIYSVYKKNVNVQQH